MQGVREFTAFKKNEIINELNVCLKHPFQTSVSTSFVPDCLKHVFVFSG